MAATATLKPGAPWEHTLDPAIVSRGPAPFLSYLFWFLIVLAIPYVAAFPLVRSKAYTEWRGSLWGPMLDFSFAPGSRNADVLIFGDSSAFIGIDPRILQAQLGVKVVLLPNTIGSLPITGDIPLQRYLATHTKPRVLVFYFSSWNLDYTKVSQARFFEGEEMMLRHGTPGEIAGFVLRHPAEVIFFPFRFYNAYGLGMIRSLFHHPQPAVSIASTLGHLDDRDAFPALASSCEFPARLFKDKSVTSVKTLVGKYTGRVPILVYMAPIPGCKNAATALRRSFSELNAAPPQVLPASDFVGDPYYAHPEPEAVPVSSGLLAQALKSRLAANPTDVPVR